MQCTTQAHILTLLFTSLSDVDHTNGSYSGASPRPEDSKTPSRTIEEMEALLLADMEALLATGSITEELPINSKDTDELRRESRASQQAVINSGIDERLSPQQKRIRAHVKAHKPKMSVRLEELSKPTAMRRFRNQDLLATALARSAEMRGSGSSSGFSSQQLSSPSSGLKENEHQEKDLMEQEEEESSPFKANGARPVRSAWETCDGEDISEANRNSNATKGPIRRGGFHRVPTYVERRNARLDELSIGASSSGRSPAGVHHRSSSSKHATLSSLGQGPAVPRHLQTISEKLLRRLDDLDNAVAGGGGEGLVSHRARDAASSALMGHPRQRHLQTSSTTLGGVHEKQQEANIRRTRRPSTSEGAIQHTQCARPLPLPPQVSRGPNPHGCPELIRTTPSSGQQFQKY